MTEAAGAVIGINFGHSYSSIACINQQYVPRPRTASFSVVCLLCS